MTGGLSDASWAQVLPALASFVLDGLTLISRWLQAYLRPPGAPSSQTRMWSPFLLPASLF